MTFLLLYCYNFTGFTWDTREKSAVPIVLSPEPANSPEPRKTPLGQFLSNITRNNEARVSQEDDHLTLPLKVKPEEPSGAFYPCQSSVHMKLIDPLKWPSYSINDPNKRNVDVGGGALNMKAITCSTVRVCVLLFRGWVLDPPLSKGWFLAPL